MNWIRGLITGFAFAFCATSFQQESDSVKIVSIQPPTETPLRVGDKAAIKVEVEYSLASADSGVVTLVIQQGESDRIPLANEADVIQKGRARIVLNKDIIVPDTKALRIFTPLSVQGATKSTVVDTRFYKVIKN